MLAGAPSAFYAGEARKALFLGDASKPLHKRTCKFCGEACPIWPRVSPDAAKRGALYDELRAITGAQTIIDSTKRVDWIEKQLRNSRQGALVFLARDGRAVLASRLRKYPARGARELAEAWRAQIEATDRLYAAHPGRKARVAYEALAAKPESVLRGLSHALDLRYDGAMVRFAEREYHVLGGNNGTQSQVAQVRGIAGPVAGERHRGYYKAHAGVIRLDERWRDELTDEARATFEDVAGDVNAILLSRGAG